MSFAELGLSDKVIQAVETAGYTQPTPIQAQAIPHVLARRDVLGIAQTGTGKTAAFVLPMLTLLESGRARARMPRTLILEPTRELAAQVEENFDRYGVNHRLSVALLIGGVSFGDQDAKINRGADVLIATPGRLLDHVERGKLLLTGVELLVIDEADRMLDMGFIPDIERVVKLVPFTRQTLFFSATMPPEIQGLADTFLHNPARIEVARPASTAATITQRLYASGSDGHEKRDVLREIIRSSPDFKNAIIFCNRKLEVAQLHKSLVRHGFSAAALHGDLDQRARMAALESFRNGEVSLLVASDVAARGLDIPAVSHVLKYDVPHHAEDYVHRIGRTGRAGRTGHAFTLVAPGDEKSLAAIESLTGQQITWEGPRTAERAPSDRPRSRPESRGREGARENGRSRSRSGGDRERTSSSARDVKPRLEVLDAGDTPPPAPGRDEDRARPRRTERSSEPGTARVPRPPREDRSPREERAPRQERSPRDDRAPREARPPREDRPAREDRAPRDARPPRHASHESEPSVVGLGDHMPAFLTRSTAPKD